MHSPLRIAFALGLACVTLLGAAQMGAPRQVLADTMQVTIKDFAFAPKAVTVPVGTTITWTNEDSAPHSATADDNSWSTKTLQQGQSDSVTFNQPGTFAYHCKVHPNMHGTVIVQAAGAAPAPTATPTPTATPATTTSLTIVVRKARAGLRFVPGTARVETGATVTWRNDTSSRMTIVGTAHWKFTSPRLRPHKVVHFLFRTAGTYKYSIAQHPSVRGTIIVRGG